MAVKTVQKVCTFAREVAEEEMAEEQGAREQGWAKVGEFMAAAGRSI